ncbi:uncharacterized protein SRS1_10327 [Sporisorium reilianum f. sp. reilianum]|uniref:Uncharacterized protein n=1 Tax=Sporisorium reilianum f. sp. reilianum TaxID=72559 RepID=A0A2N8U8E2_9BASI|nr:uncharacterized protein SRS1_10327 [Sporisorium reilianum f. sp. reilianum]
MASYIPHERNESASSTSHNPVDTSGSSSAEYLRKEAPHTPPQIHLGFDAVAVSSGPGFSEFFPWIQQDDTTRPMDVHECKDSQEPETMHIAAFEQRDAAYLPRNSLQAPKRTAAAQSVPSWDSNQVSQASPLSASHQSPELDTMMLSASQPGNAACRTPTSEGAAVVHETHQTPSPGVDASNQARMVASSSSPQPPARRLSLAVPSHDGCRSSTGPRLYSAADYAELAEQECCAGDVVLDMFEDDRLPGYQVWRRGATSSSAIAVRIPRQLMGWKAVLMDVSGLDDVSSSKKVRRASKVMGKQGWEVRQEALKNSYDFRRGSGIWATMHAGHRLFKHDWHIIVKDGSRYVWRMDKHALALFREEDEVKVAEFCKAVPSSGGVEQGERAGGKRIGSFRFQGERSRIRPGRPPDGDIFGMNMALASLVAVFGARGGHSNVSAAFEPSSDPMRDVLEQQRQEAPDREQEMLALPRPGFARDAESVLSDTTDEDAGEPTGDTLRPRRVATNQQRSLAASSEVRQAQTHTRNDRSGANSKGRKRFSSFFGRASAPAVVEDEGGAMTDSQRIARQYRHQSVLLGS